MSRSLSFRREDRLSRSSEVRTIIRVGKRTTNNYFTLFYQIGSTEKRRLGLAFGKQVGGTVTRNRLKRIVREYFRLHREFLPVGLEVVIMARGDLSALSSRQIRGLLETLFQRANLLAYEPPQRPS